MRLQNVFLAAVPLLVLLSVYLIIMPEFREIPMSVRISNYTGFDVNTTALTFGTLAGGGTANRTVIISNMDDFSKIGLLSATGDIADYVYMPASVTVGAFSNATVNVWVQPPGGTLREYNGTLRVFLRRAI